jgi:hypothetical protein
MSRLVYLVTLSASAVMMSGCDRGFDGYIAFQNSSGTNLEWVTVSGFPRNPPVGVLVRGTEAGAFMHSMVLPETVTVTWRLEREADQKSVLSLSPVPPGVRGGEIWFDFTADRKWVVSYKKEEIR